MGRLMEDDGTFRMLARAAAAAPLIHHAPPMRLTVAAADTLELRADPDRVLWAADPRGRALNISCGAALFNLRLAIRMTGCRALVWAHPAPASDPNLVASVRLVRGRRPSRAERQLFDLIGVWRACHAPFTERSIPEQVLASMERAAAAELVALRLLNYREAALVLAPVEDADVELGADIDRQAEPRHRASAEADARELVTATALRLRPGDPAPVRHFRLAPAAAMTAGRFELSPQLLVLCSGRDDPADWLRCGQALQRVLLTATRHGLATSLLYQPIELHHTQRDERPRALTGYPQIIIRTGYASPPCWRGDAAQPPARHGT